MRNLIEAIIRLNNAASTDSIRYNLNGVHVKAVTVMSPEIASVTTWTLQATDGRILASESFDIAACDIQNADFIIPSDAIPKLKLFLKAVGKGAESGFHLSVKTHVNAMRLCFAWGPNPTNPVESCEILLLDGEFPNTKTIVPTDTDRFVIGLNPELLMDLFKALNSEKRNTLMVLEINTKEPLSPIRVSVAYSDGTGVIMPMRVSADKKVGN